MIFSQLLQGKDDTPLQNILIEDENLPMKPGLYIYETSQAMKSTVLREGNFVKFLFLKAEELELFSFIS